MGARRRPSAGARARRRRRPRRGSAAAARLPRRRRAQAAPDRRPRKRDGAARKRARKSRRRLHAFPLLLPPSLPRGLPAELQARLRRLAGRPIAAQYGGYARSRLNFVGMAGARPVGAHDHSTMGRLRSCRRSSPRPPASGGIALAARADRQAEETEYVEHLQCRRLSGVLAADGVCVRLSGYVSSQFSGGQLKVAIKCGPRLAVESRASG